MSLGGRYTNDKRHASHHQDKLLGGGAARPRRLRRLRHRHCSSAPLSNFDGRRKDTAFTPRASVNFKPTPNHNHLPELFAGFQRAAASTRAATPPMPRTTRRQRRRRPSKSTISWPSIRRRSTATSWAGRRRCSIAGSSSRRRSSRPTIRTFRCRARPACTTVSAAWPTTGFFGITTNAGKARFRGVEFETNARVANDLATAGDRLNLAGTLGYLDGKYLEFITNIAGCRPRTDVGRLPQDPEHPQMDAQRIAGLRHAGFGGRLNAEHHAVLPQQEPAIRARDARSRPEGLCVVGRQPRLALARQPLRARSPRQEPDQQEIYRRGLQFLAAESVHRRCRI